MTILLGNAVTEHEVKELRLLRAEKAISSEAEEKLKYLLGVAKNPEDFLLWKLLCHLRLEFIRCFKERKSLQHPNVPSQSQNYEQITELNAVMISSASQIVDIITQILPKMNEIKELLESEKEEVRRLRAISEAVIKNIVADEHQLSGLSIKNMEEREM